MNFRLRAALSAVTLLLLALPAKAADLQMKVTDNGYLRGRGASVMLYSDTYSPIFFDQKDSGLQILLHGHRIATNGSLRLAPTPEQWSLIPHLDSRHADKAQDRLTANLSYSSYHLSYQVVVAADREGFASVWIWTSRCPRRWWAGPDTISNSCPRSTWKSPMK